MTKFQAGDRVYFPLVDGNIRTLQENCGSSLEVYPFLIQTEKHSFYVSKEGKINLGYDNPSIYLATPENCKTLSGLFGKIENPFL